MWYYQNNMYCFYKYGGQGAVMKDYPLFTGKNCDAFEKFIDADNDCRMVDGRIPSLLALKNGDYAGTVVAAADKASCGADWGFIEIAVRRSEDNGLSFGEMQTVFTPPVRVYPENPDDFTSAFAIDPLLMESNDGKVIILVDFYPESKGLHAPKYMEKGSGYSLINGENCLKLYSGKTKLDGFFVRKGREFTLHPDGYVYDPDGKKTRYYIPKNHSAEHAYSTIGDMYYCVGDKPQYIEEYPPLFPENKEGEDIYVGNIYVSQNKASFSADNPKAVTKKEYFGKDGKFICAQTQGAPLRAPMISYIFKLESTDGGKTFSQPVDITHFYKKNSDGIFLGVGPGVGLTLKNKKFSGRILAPTYILGKALVLISDDGGETWRRNSGEFCANIDECQLVEMPDGKVFCFGRPKGGGKIPLSVSDDGGDTFRKLAPIEPKVPQCQRAVVNVPADFMLPDSMENDGRYLLLSTPTGHNGKDTTRTDGKVFLGRIDGEAVKWLKTYNLTDAEKYASFGKYSDFFAYSSIAALADNTVGVLYEAYPSGYITFAKFEL